MALKPVNNCTTQLIADLATAATVMSVVTTQKMPALGAGDYVYATLISIGAGFDNFGNPNLFEIVKIVGPLTPGAGQAVTIVRAQDGTAAAQFTAGDIVDLRVNRATLLDAASTGPTIYKINVKDYGAVGNGVTDDTAALNAALGVANGVGNCTVYFPAGTYLTSTGVTITASGVQLLGENENITYLKNTSPDNPTITVNGSLTYIGVQNFQLIRSVPAVAGGDGVLWGETGSTGEGFIYNIQSRGNYNGFQLGGMVYGQFGNLLAEQNYRDGIVFQTFGVNAALQWYGGNCLSQRNDRHGFFVWSNTSVGNVSLGTWGSLYTFANSGGGLYLLGTVSAPLQALRLSECLFGQDGGSEITLDTYGSLNSLTDNFIELGGTSNTGRTLSTPPTGTSFGIFVTANTLNFTASGNTITGQSRGGINTSSPMARILNNRIEAYGSSAGGTSNQAGIVVAAGAAQIENNLVGNGATSLYGVYTLVDTLQLIGNDLRNNVSAAVFGALAASVAANNLPIIPLSPQLVASATTTILPNTGSLFSVSGTTTIVGLSSGVAGRVVTLVFQSALTVTNGIGANLIALSGGVNFSVIANSTLSLVYNGTQWFEVGRKA